MAKRESRLHVSQSLTESNVRLLGTPVELEANSSTGAITVTLGPFTGGPPFVGQTLVVDDFLSMKVKTS